MNDTETTQNDGDMPIYDAVKYLSKEDLEQTVRKNAGDRDFSLNDEHLEVIYSLLAHYKRDCTSVTSRMICRIYCTKLPPPFSRRRGFPNEALQSDAVGG